MKKSFQYLTAGLLAAFGLLTLFLSTSVIFDLFGIRAREGNYVLFIVWANFISSILYLVSAYGIIRKKNYPPVLLGISSLLLITAFGALMIHIKSGGLYEEKTISAMIFRIITTLIFTAIAFIINKRK